MLRQLFTVLTISTILAISAGVVSADLRTPAPTPGPTGGVHCPDGYVMIDTTCHVDLTVPGSPGAVPGGGRAPVDTGPVACEYKGAPIDCTVNGASWSPARQCYVKKSDPQPSFDDPLWGGRTDGVIVDCIPSGCTLDLTGVPPAGAVGPAKTERCFIRQMWVLFVPGSPEELAHTAVVEMDITAPQMGLTGHGDDPSAMQVLGLPTWMWVSDPGDSTTGPVTRYASAGGVTVQATGRLTSTVWTMGDGASVTCNGDKAAGTPYEASYGAQIITDGNGKG